jgi:uncharacterized membrane protein
MSVSHFVLNLLLNDILVFCSNVILDKPLHDKILDFVLQFFHPDIIHRHVQSFWYLLKAFVRAVSQDRAQSRNYLCHLCNSCGLTKIFFHLLVDLLQTNSADADKRSWAFQKS